MSKTIRRGKPSRNYSRYTKLGVIHHEHDGFISCYDKSYISLWEQFDGQSYGDYLEATIRDYHRDGRQGQFSGVPREVRRTDVQAQKLKHQRAIRRAIQIDDFDVVLAPLVKFNSWHYH